MQQIRKEHGRQLLSDIHATYGHALAHSRIHYAPCLSRLKVQLRKLPLMSAALAVNTRYSQSPAQTGALTSMTPG